MIIETELKLTIVEKDISKLLAHPILRNSGSEQQKLHLYSVYFDTPGLDLCNHGYALRIRQNGDEFIQMIKGQNTAAGGLHQRAEWPSQVVDLDHPDLTALPNPELYQNLRDQGLLQQVQPLFVTDFQRIVINIISDSNQIELAIDQGEVRAGDLSEAVNEVELELLAGTEASLQTLADQLAKDISLIPEPMSKAQRGYRLYRDEK